MSTLGEELISNERVALTELVKNAYDADASLVLIRFLGPLPSEVAEKAEDPKAIESAEGVDATEDPDSVEAVEDTDAADGPEDAGAAKATGCIEVWDNGHGMSPETVRGTWLDIATAYRQRAPRSESRGRRVLGAKGIGRFSAARLALVTELATRRIDSSEEVSLRIKWRDFIDGESYLDQVPVRWSVGEPAVFAPWADADLLFDDLQEKYGAGVSSDSTHVDSLWGDAESPHGTVMRLVGLRQVWDDHTVTLLKRSLSRLLPPPAPTELSVPGTPDFAICLEFPPGDLEHHSGFVAASEALAHPDYRLTGAVDAEGNGRFRMSLAAEGTTTEVNLKLPTEAVRPSCGPLEVDIRAWDLEGHSVRRLVALDVGAKNISEVRQLIRGNSGVVLYRDGFRVLPFGEPGDDWLQLNLRRVNNPTMRFSSNQVAGYVYITADGNPGLRDRSHREGLIDSKEYEDLKKVLATAVSALETERYRVRRLNQPTDPGSQQPSSGSEGGHGHGVFNSFTLEPLRKVVEERYADDAVLGRALDEATGTINESVKKVQEILSQFSRLATLGTLVDVVLHDGRSALTRIAYDLQDLDDVILGIPRDNETLVQALNDVRTSFASQEKALDRLFTRIQPLSGRRRGRPRSISLQHVISEAVSVYEGEIKKLNVEVTIEGQDTMVTMDPGDINQVIVNLVGNALYWLSTQEGDEDRRIRIDTERLPDGGVEIMVSDSGPGVREEIRNLIFDTYFSDKEDGIGLGLSIAGSVVQDFYDGKLALVSEGPLPGACFKATLRRSVG
ncbi:sensor histidine kinase [Streptomyces microflavus]|uniref:sensor histidine kinase n=1 Tax=Streptomyces microflavus TaxID=1919 RepID=UPI0033ABDE28